MKVTNDTNHKKDSDSDYQRMSSMHVIDTGDAIRSPQNLY